MYNQLSLKTTIYTRLGPSPPLDCFEKTIPTRQNKKRALTKSTSIAALTKSALFLPFFCCWRYCGIRDPSWAELHHFVNFLNSQLRDAEESIFCITELVGDLLQGFRTFVVRFLIQMSRVRLTIIWDILFFDVEVSVHSPVPETLSSNTIFHINTYFSRISLPDH